MSCFSIPSDSFMTDVGDMPRSIRCVSPPLEDDEFSSAPSMYASPRPLVDTPEDLEIVQDETSIRVTLDMEGVKGRDISISVQDGILTIEGYRRGLGDCRKKQRLQRKFPVDTDVVDLSRAMANIWKNTLVLYAPKKASRTSIPFTEEPDFEFSSPAANRIVALERAAATA